MSKSVSNSPEKLKTVKYSEAHNLTFERRLYDDIRISSQRSKEDYFNFMERKEKGRLPYGLIKEVIALAFSKYLDVIPLKHYPFLINVE